MNNKQGFGFTLIELMIVVAILGILVSLAVPSFAKMIERNRLKEAAESIKSDLQWMRTEAIKQSCDLKASFDNSVWDYDIYQPDGTCTCPVGSNCSLRAGAGSQFEGVTMGSASFFPGGTTTVTINFRRGVTDNNGGVILNSSYYQLKVVISKIGRVTICNSDSSKSIGGYDAC